MGSRIPRSWHQHHRHAWWWRLGRWQRVVVIGVLAGALVISAALIYFQPGAEGEREPAPSPARTGTVAPQYPPGTRWYYRRSQWYQPESPPP